ncbi:MAG: DUF4040 domain-containing protein, partial [Candidatus Aminicenantes bacterium]|nr:DUF4040 domain-containing protein [Candidatus Aminicenantes bacterium]
REMGGRQGGPFLDDGLDRPARAPLPRLRHPVLAGRQVLGPARRGRARGGGSLHDRFLGILTMIVQTALLVGLVLFSVLAIVLRDLLKAAISLAVASLLLGIVFFRMNAPYAGVFEISVVAGLITVLFILTIALTNAGEEVRESRIVRWVFPLFFLAFIVIDALVMKGLLQKIPALPSAPEIGTFGDVLWKGRTLDLVGQIAVILAGVFAVLALFRKRDKHD